MKLDAHGTSAHPTALCPTNELTDLLLPGIIEGSDGQNAALLHFQCGLRYNFDKTKQKCRKFDE
jgi:hypothetical protein